MCAVLSAQSRLAHTRILFPRMKPSTTTAGLNNFILSASAKKIFGRTIQSKTIRCRRRPLSTGSNPLVSDARNKQKGTAMTTAHEHSHSDEGHAHKAAPMVEEISDYEVLELAVRELCIERG